MASQKASSPRQPTSDPVAAGSPDSGPAEGSSAGRPSAAPAPPSGPARWVQYLTLGLSLIGLGVSVYETQAHFTGNHLAGCPSNVHATFDCSAVITSPQSMVFGVIPVAILGLAFYLFAVAVFSPWAWRLRWPAVGWLRLGSMIVGMGFVMYLIYAEVVQIQQVCEYCTAVHIITFLLFCVTVVAAAFWGVNPRRDEG
ncbi:MAG: vitamin K epoxide reductase family protein [Nocardiopsaceae bacterium]|nr:vitamin K epoxide reductase family protein [Nocardiopsaceae bacterium]